MQPAYAFEDGFTDCFSEDLGRKALSVGNEPRARQRTWLPG